MAESGQGPEGVGSSGASSNVQAGDVARNLVQARDVHGGIHLERGGRAAWWWFGGAATAVIVLLAVLVVSRWDRPERNTGVAPAQFRVTADLSVNDEKPWAYVSDSAVFPDPELLDRLSQRDGVLDPVLVRRVRTTPGAFPLSEQTIRLHLEGPADHDVRVTGIRPVVRTERDVPRGTALKTNGEGSEASVQVFLALDDPFPVAREAVERVPGLPEPGNPFFPGHTISLVRGETGEVVLTARARDHAYEYDLLVTYQVGDRVEEVTVNDGGQPFRISGRACRVAGSSPYAVELKMGLHYGLEPAATVPDPDLPPDSGCGR